MHEARLLADDTDGPSIITAIVDAFYGFLSDHMETKWFLRDDATVARLKIT
jgi:hypothetical protein